MKWNNSKREMKKCENCSEMIPKLPTWKRLCIPCYIESKNGYEPATEMEAHFLNGPQEVSDYYENGRGEVYETHYGNELPEDF